MRIEDGGYKTDFPPSILDLPSSILGSLSEARRMKKKLRVAILFGGQSAEHEISLISARNIAAAMDRKKYEIVAVGIDKQGRWFIAEGGRLLRESTPSRGEFRDGTRAQA